MDCQELEVIVLRLLLTIVAGGLIGFERSYHGRSAGFRTHALVCMASGLLMLLTGFQWHFIPEQYMSSIRVDPTRMAQGLMTGIGFLGAGVIVKEGLNVRGLTTAASIWMTAAIGIIIGLGFYSAALVTTMFAVGILSLFQYVERLMPVLHYARLEISFLDPDVMPEEALYRILADHDISGISLGYRQESSGRVFRYNATLRTTKRANLRRLSDSLRAIEAVHEFSIRPAGV